MPKIQKASLQIPFDGFYHSVTDSLIDGEVEQYHDNFNDGEYPDYTVNFLAIAKRYAAEYKEWLEDNHGLILKSLQFDELVIPKQYNFTTDKIFCFISAKDQYTLFNWWKNNYTYEEKQEIIDDRFKSCGGFASFYDDFCSEWQTKPFTEWDENEKSILFPDPDYCDLWENAVCNGFFGEVITFNENNTETVTAGLVL